MLLQCSSIPATWLVLRSIILIIIGCSCCLSKHTWNEFWRRLIGHVLYFYSRKRYFAIIISVVWSPGPIGVYQRSLPVAWWDSKKWITFILIHSGYIQTNRHISIYRDMRKKRENDWRNIKQRAGFPLQTTVRVWVQHKHTLKVELWGGIDQL